MMRCLELHVTVDQPMGTEAVGIAIHIVPEPPLRVFFLETSVLPLGTGPGQMTFQLRICHA